MRSWRRACPQSAASTPTCARRFIRIAGFLYGWVLLLVIQTGGMAAVTVTFARYLLELTGWQVSERLIVGAHPRGADHHQLPGREAGQPRAERADAAEDRSHRRD